jgi:regulatory subunit for Cdc7p protein kinase
MATLFPPPQPSAPHTSPRQAAMASRRVPLGNLPNAANSPFREAIVPGTKRPRDAGFSKEPPAKKQAIEVDDIENRRSIAGKKIQAATAVNGTRRAASGVKAASVKAASQENLSEIRQWQKHYKKLFPTMVFYYDNVPDETRHKISKQIQLLGSVSNVPFSQCALSTK